MMTESKVVNQCFCQMSHMMRFPCVLARGFSIIHASLIDMLRASKAELLERRSLDSNLRDKEHRPLDKGTNNSSNLAQFISIRDRNRKTPLPQCLTFLKNSFNLERDIISTRWEVTKFDIRPSSFRPVSDIRNTSRCPETTASDGRIHRKTLKVKS